MVLKYPAAERIAQEITLHDGVSLDAQLERWAEHYRRRHGVIPGPSEGEAAREVIEIRLRNDVPPPLPPSASSSRWGRCTFETGVPKDPDAE